MQQFLIGLIVVLGLSSYYLYNENKVLSTNNALLEGAVETQKETITTLQNDFATQTEGLLTIQSKNQAIEAEMNRYLDIFKRHNLTKLAAAKPGLIEPKINKGTKNVFDSIEEDSRNIDSLDDGVQLQPNTK
jgi:predicted nucleotide-binding protein (sugar kinase/HSP70/actin superfamily)|tara:strand:+ start:228 stop:623 length:396 start_codon:yes stop_codon:yes gene_type:complete